MVQALSEVLGIPVASVIPEPEPSLVENLHVLSGRERVDLQAATESPERAAVAVAAVAVEQKASVAILGAALVAVVAQADAAERAVKVVHLAVHRLCYFCSIAQKQNW